ncbi:MAG: hypothetical protein CMF42_02660 [Legionellales bacterium]|nr:hypothetical protein [Legionellales bacterium]OUX67678.1 MAG: hypothetical protein CBD38_01525 [bacterium TMED178]|tara:strand:- start:8075 stop:8737 length:663 start_codon:yes stop_codon:yes gene_type:complete
MRFLFCTLVLLFSMTGCSNNPKDPFEPYNRQMYTINDSVDKVVVKPLSELYDHIVPEEIETVIRNFFSNLGEPIRFINDVLQLNFKGAMVDVQRFGMNSTFGLFGAMDFADGLANLPKRTQSYGMTIAYWTGNRLNQFLVLPLLGPSTIGNSIGLGLTAYTNHAIDLDIENYSIALKILQKRSDLLKFDSLITLQVDPYIAMREAYMTKNNQLYQKIISE